MVNFSNRYHELHGVTVRTDTPEHFMEDVYKRQAWVGAAVVLLVITAVGQRIKDIMVILILGMMFSSGVGAVVQI